MSSLPTSGDTSNRAYGYLPQFEEKAPQFETSHTTFDEIDKVIHGLLSPDDIYRQLPETLRMLLDTHSVTETSKPFKELSLIKKIEVFKKFKPLIEIYYTMGLEKKTELEPPQSTRTGALKPPISATTNKRKKVGFFKNLIHKVFKI